MTVAREYINKVCLNLWVNSEYSVKLGQQLSQPLAVIDVLSHCKLHVIVICHKVISVVNLHLCHSSVLVIVIINVWPRLLLKQTAINHEVFGWKKVDKAVSMEQ